MLSFPATYTRLRSNLANVSCHRALLAAGPEGVTDVLLVPALQRLIVRANQHRLQSDVASPLPERTNNGVRLLLPRGPGSALALGQDPTPKRHGYVRPVVPDLLKDCPYGIVRGIRP